MEFKNFNDFIRYYESLKSFQWYDFCSTENIIKKLKDNEKNKLKYERLAFWFMYKRDLENIYAPFFEFIRDDWTILWSPDRSRVDSQCIDYWNERLKSCKSDFMKFRYSTLLLDFSIQVVWRNETIKKFGKDYFYNLTNQVVDSWIIILKEKKLYHNVYWKDYIEIMIRFWDIYAQNRLLDIATACISFEEDIAEDDSPWLWWFSCRYLLLNENSNIEKYLTEKQKNKIILDLNCRLKRLLKTDNINWIEHCIEDLLQYYNKSWDTKKIQRLLLELKKAYNNKNMGNLHPMILESYNENLKRLYLMYDKDNKNVIDSINRENGILWQNILDSLKKYSFNVTISKKEYNNIINLYYDVKKKELKKWAFCIWMIPSREKSEQALDRLIKDFPLQYRAVVKKYDKSWVCIAKIDPSIDDAIKRQRISQYQHDISLNFSLNEVCKLIKKNNSNENLFKNWLLLECVEVEILENLRNLYINWNNLEFCCIAIPLIESSFRKMLQNVWWCIFMNKEWGIEYKNLHQIFDDELLTISIPRVFKDFIYYCRVILIEKHGFNLRNNLSHWIDLICFWDDTVANRIFHILICLSILEFIENW